MGQHNAKAPGTDLAVRDEVIDAEIVETGPGGRDLEEWRGVIEPTPEPVTVTDPEAIARIQARVEYGERIERNWLARLLSREPRGWRRHADA